MAGIRSRRIIGLMSGTSCDGVDAALVEVVGRGLVMRAKLIDHRHRRYPPVLRERLLTVMAPAKTTTQELCDLAVTVGGQFAKAAIALIRSTDVRAEDIDLIGSHGQTICHLPPVAKGRGSTLQIGDAAVIAARTGVPVVSDFRQADMAHGGQGAPLVPWTDYVLFRNARLSSAIQNIGGIANVTYVPSGGGPEDVIAFDTGPGNMIVDELVRRITGGRRSFDRNGRRAARGRVHDRLLKKWMSNPYFRRRPPKSCGREQFGAAFVDRAVGTLDVKRRGDDLVATATALTARTIAGAYRRFLPSKKGKPAIDRLVVCGGGARNSTLMAMLAGELPGIDVVPIERFGITDQAKEAVSFAMLAAACADGVPANLPQVTGATRPAILGRITRV
ncbi:MAG: anhydro-N-acetylmuramic acid kinase [Phycisphaerae bacterium]|nr:anhydro-N-acetylmuramic acid kinase [Phycisphaerae bacterium]